MNTITLETIAAMSASEKLAILGEAALKMTGDFLLYAGTAFVVIGLIYTALWAVFTFSNCIVIAVTGKFEELFNAVMPKRKPAIAYVGEREVERLIDLELNSFR